MSSRKYTYAIFGVFFVESGVLGTWIPRIPDIKEKLGLSDGDLGLSLLAMPLGTLIGLFVAARIIELLGGLRRACQVFLPLWALSFILPAPGRGGDEHRGRSNRAPLQEQNHVSLPWLLEPWINGRGAGRWCSGPNGCSSGNALFNCDANVGCSGRLYRFAIAGAAPQRKKPEVGRSLTDVQIAIQVNRAAVSAANWNYVG